jgi:hypothetical protein
MRVCVTNDLKGVYLILLRSSSKLLSIFEVLQSLKLACFANIGSCGSSRRHCLDAGDQMKSHKIIKLSRQIEIQNWVGASTNST